MICEFCLNEGLWDVKDEHKLREKCYEHCQESEDGEHEPDPSTFHLERDGYGTYVDINCKHCGLSGCVGKYDASDVSW